MNDAVSLSQRLYRGLLRAYPPSFRSEYGDEMALTFRDACRAAHRRGGAAGVLGQWVETVPDFVVSVVDEHAQEKFQMAKTNLARLLSVAGIVGGAMWIAFGVLQFIRTPGVTGGASRQADDPGLLLVLALGLVSAGLVGVAMRPARDWPAAARGLLLLAVAGGLWTPLTSLLTENWFVLIAGYFVMVIGLAIGGLLLVTSPAHRRWAALFVALGATMLLFNTEDWRALFGVVTGILAIVVSALALSSALNRPSEPPVAAA